jgi:hypothetical protein
MDWDGRGEKQIPRPNGRRLDVWDSEGFGNGDAGDAEGEFLRTLNGAAALWVERAAAF